jgi:RNase P/RNase MRP subunit POP5
VENREVKKAVIPAWGAILVHCSDKQVVEKVYVQFHNLKDHPLTDEELESGIDVALISTFGKACVSAEARFREDG